ncbi:MAG TPA: DUF1028 domain-containing protein [Longimicrobiales bacterium]|jgi:uncharacterized Ntn-hydrolase superfamily protein
MTHTRPCFRDWRRAVAASALLAMPAFAQSPRPADAIRPVATYSIVARDSLTGEMGVAVQSHWFSVGAIVPWAQAGVGAVATQSFVDPSYGPLGLELMRMGRSASEALLALVSTDSNEAVRQVAMVDAGGDVTAHTGSSAIYAAGHHIGDGYSTQANMMERPTVWDAMARAYEESEGDLAERLLAALEAAQAEGGDIRGRQSAALVVVSAEATGLPWVDRRFDLRVEDHPTPVAELRRLVRLQRAYLKLNEGDEWVTAGEVDRAMEAYRDAMELVPDAATNGEAPFWVGVTLAASGRDAEAAPYLARAQAQDGRWAELILRLPRSGLLPSAEMAERLSRAMRGGG